MSWDQYNQTPASNDLANYFQTGMAPSKVKNAGWDIMADLAQFMSLPTSGGTANAQTVTNTRQFGALFTGMRQSFIPGNTNTGAVTLAIDGLTAKNVFANGVAAIAGMLVAGTVAHVQYDGTQWQLLNPQRSTGSFTATLKENSGATTIGSGTISYAISQNGKDFKAWAASAITGTSGHSDLTITGVPTVLQSTTNKEIFSIYENGGGHSYGTLQTGTSSIWTGLLQNGSGALSATNFGTSGVKGLLAGWCIETSTD